MKEIYVNIQPSLEEKKVSVSIHMDGMSVKKGEMVFAIETRIIMKKFIELDAPMSVTDDLGEIPCTLENTTMMQYVDVEKHMASRDTVGSISISYTGSLQPVGVNPVFDYGYEDVCINGSGHCFLPDFPEGKYMYHLRWNLSKMPAESIGVWSYGEGNIDRMGSEQELTLTYYDAGLLSRVKMGRFGYYWAENEAMLDAAVHASKLFNYESKFFRDADLPYNIFVRHNANPNGHTGGTALTRSYACLYSDGNDISAKALDNLFAHEMVHNWVTLNDEPFGTCTWYVEGMAEYYCCKLTYKLGLASLEDTLKQFNSRAEGYFQNPRRKIENAEIGKHLMADPEMTRVPYGRGFFYFTHADTMIRRATGNEKCLDDLVLTLNERYKADHKCANETWVEEYGKYVGQEVAQKEYDDMSSGKPFAPELTYLEGKAVIEEVPGTERETNEPCTVYRYVKAE